MPRGLRAAGSGVLGRAPGFRLLFLAALGSSVGTWLAYVALVIDVFDRTRDANWVSALLIVEFLPLVVVGLLAGQLVDRFERRRLLIVADLVRAGIFCALPFAGSATHVVLLALGAGLATSLFRPAVYAGLPNLVAADDVPRANGLLQSAENMTWAIGALAGGAVVAGIGLDAAYWINAGTFLLSALLLARIRESLEEERAASRGRWRDLVDGIALVRGSRPLTAVLLAWSLFMLGSAGVNVAEVVLAKVVFDAGDFGYGLLLAAAAVGLVIGNVVAGGSIERLGMRLPYGASLALTAAAFGAAAAAPNVWLAAAAVVVAGVGNGTANVCNAVLVQRAAPDRLRGRAFTLLMGATSAVLGLGMIAAGPLTNAVGARAVWAIAAVVIAGAAVVGYALLGGPTKEQGEAALAGRGTL